MYLVNTMVIKTNAAVPVLMNIICGEGRQSTKYMIVINATRDREGHSGDMCCGDS